mmetsp:Transcript_81075/g.252979  ORF Transcript_81075/g.252979 Transcript_81075/m.252979 type:complete len:241 (-) Transcript_81075:198-920(-)
MDDNEHLSPHITCSTKAGRRKAEHARRNGLSGVVDDACSAGLQQREPGVHCISLPQGHCYPLSFADTELAFLGIDGIVELGHLQLELSPLGIDQQDEAEFLEDGVHLPARAVPRGLHRPRLCVGLYKDLHVLGIVRPCVFVYPDHINDLGIGLQLHWRAPTLHSHLGGEAWILPVGVVVAELAMLGDALLAGTVRGSLGSVDGDQRATLHALHLQGALIEQFDRGRTLAAVLEVQHLVLR